MAGKYFGTSMKIASGFGLGSQQPLDARTVCETVEEMNNIPAIQLYAGLVIYVEENKKFYKYENGKFNQLSVEQVIDNLTSDVTDIGLSAKQGKVLKGLIDNLDSTSNNIQEIINSLKQKDTEHDEAIALLVKADETINNLIKQITEVNSNQDKEIESLKKKDTELEQMITDTAGDSGKVKITSEDTMDYLGEKIKSGDKDFSNGVFPVNVTNAQNSLKLNVDIPLFVWTKL